MPVYELIPQKFDDPNWKCSIHRKSLIIRARDERMARMKANTAFGIGALRENLYSKIPSNPWTNAELVSCQELKDSEYPLEGEEGILYPENY